jgi:hypothetical protein
VSGAGYRPDHQDALRTGEREEDARPACAHDWQALFTGPRQTHLICSRCERKLPIASVQAEAAGLRDECRQRLETHVRAVIRCATRVTPDAVDAVIFTERALREAIDRLAALAGGPHP